MNKELKKPVHVKPSYYVRMFQSLKEIALKYGYNLVLHGSLNKELEKAAKEYSMNGEYQFMSTFQQMAQKAFIAGANWQASNTIITDNSLVIDNLEKEIERLKSLLLKQ